MRRPNIVWLCLATGSIGMIALVSLASSEPARDKRATGEKVARFSYGRGADDEAPDTISCKLGDKVDLKKVTNEQRAAAWSLIQNGLEVKDSLTTLYGSRAGNCFGQLIESAEHIVAGSVGLEEFDSYDADSVGDRSIVGDLLGGIFGKGIGETIDSVTDGLQTGIENIAPDGFGELTKGVASIGNGIVGVIAGAAGIDANKAKEREKKRQEEAAEKAKKAKKASTTSKPRASAEKLSKHPKESKQDKSKNIDTDDDTLENLDE